jgi:DNA-binding NarL/FixJ family response regulator
MSDCQLLLIVAPPGPFRDGLRILVQAEPRIARVHIVETIAEGCRCIAQQLPDRLIIDADLPDPALWSFGTLLKTLSPPPCCIIIIHNQEQQRAAQAVGMPILLAGFTAEALFDALFDAPAASLTPQIWPQ